LVDAHVATPPAASVGCHYPPRRLALSSLLLMTTGRKLFIQFRYAHLAPDHLQEVVKLNPLTALTLR